MTFAPYMIRVRDEWIDYNGHLSEAYYVLVFGHATDAVMEHLGLGADYRDKTGCSLYTVEAHLRYLDQVLPRADLEIRTRVIGSDPKRMDLWHEMYADGRLQATEELVTLHVDSAAGRTTPFPDDIAAAIESRLTPAPPESIRVRTRTSGWERRGQRPERPHSGLT